MEKKNTAQFKYVVKSVPLSIIITVPPWSYAKRSYAFKFYMDIGTQVK